MQALAIAALAVAGGSVATPSFGHEVRERVEQATATVVVLTYADDEPFRFERYELFVPGRERPVQTGTTDARGRIVFLADGARRWRVRSVSSDGHGVDVEFDAADAPAATPVAHTGSSRPLRIGLGLVAIMAAAWVLRALVARAKPQRKAGDDAHP